MISEDQASTFFSPIQSSLVKIILESWKQIHSSELNFKSRSRASLMWDETLYRANLEWCDSEHITKIDEKPSQTAHYWFNKNTFFRIKKGDNKGFTSNYPTQSALEFHEIQSDIFGSVNRLEVTYVLSNDETEIQDIAVVHRNGGKVNFRFSLLNSENVAQLPHQNSQEKHNTNEHVAKLKLDKLPKKNKEQVNDE